MQHRAVQLPKWAECPLSLACPVPSQPVRPGPQARLPCDLQSGSGRVWSGLVWSVGPSQPKCRANLGSCRRCCRCCCSRRRDTFTRQVCLACPSVYLYSPSSLPLQPSFRTTTGSSPPDQHCLARPPFSHEQDTPLRHTTAAPGSPNPLAHSPTNQTKQTKETLGGSKNEEAHCHYSVQRKDTSTTLKDTLDHSEAAHSWNTHSSSSPAFSSPARYSLLLTPQKCWQHLQSQPWACHCLSTPEVAPTVSAPE